MGKVEKCVAPENTHTPLTGVISLFLKCVTALNFWMQGLKLTFTFRSQLATNRKILVANLCYIKKVTIEERKQFKTTQVTLSYKATVVVR